ncbi:MAG: oxidoreductase [Chromatiales bacterium]|nr:oxidoreductase [Chromatiales bacterium]
MLEARGENVTVFVRPTSDTTELEKLGVELVVGDAMDIATVHAAFDGHDYEAVLTTIGCLNCDPPSDYQANANVIKAAKQAGVRRLVLVTSIGSGDSLAATPALSARFLAKIIPLKTLAEEYLRTSGLDYTIIRPGGLRSGRRTGNGTLSEGRDVFGYIFREDLAELIVSVFDDNATIGKTLAAVDAYRRFPWDNE